MYGLYDSNLNDQGHQVLIKANRRTTERPLGRGLLVAVQKAALFFYYRTQKQVW